MDWVFWALGAEAAFVMYSVCSRGRYLLQTFARNVQTIAASFTRCIGLQFLLKSAALLDSIRGIAIHIIRHVHPLTQSSLHLLSIHATIRVTLTFSLPPRPPRPLTEHLPRLKVLLGHKFVLEGGAFLDVLVGARARIEGLLDAVEVCALYL